LSIIKEHGKEIVLSIIPCFTFWSLMIWTLGHLTIQIWMYILQCSSYPGA
jgi:hypothetical protein